jgi:hypothetical protein
LLPYLERENLHDSLNAELWIASPENQTVIGTRVSTFVCPSDIPSSLNDRLPFAPLSSSFDVAIGSYQGNYGTLAMNLFPESFPPTFVVPPEARRFVNGVLNDLSPLRQQDILDGMSFTVFASERRTDGFLRLLPNDRPHRIWLGPWSVGNLTSSFYVATAPPNLPIQTGEDFAAAIAGASSEHPGGLYCLFGDGSVRFVSNAIESWDWKAPYIRDHLYVNLPPPGVWQRMATRADGD